MKKILNIRVIVFGAMFLCIAGSCAAAGGGIPAGAVQDNNIAGVRTALENGADANKKDESGVTPICWAIIFNSSDIIKLLVQNGADVNETFLVPSTDGTGIKSPLIWAVENNNVEIARLMIEKGADIKRGAVMLDKQIGSMMSVTPLMLAAENNSVEMAKLLLEKGADINEAKGSYVSLDHGALKKPLGPAKKVADEPAGITPLMWAAACNSLDVAKLLIEQGANINDIWIYAKVLDFAKSEEMKNLLRSSGALSQHETDKNEQPRFNELDLKRAILDNSPAKVKKLIAGGADANTKGALMLAVLKNYSGIAKLLIEHGADVNAAEGDGKMTALMLAARYNSVKTAKLLIEKGADIKAENADGDTALSIAEINGNKGVIELLKKPGSRKPAYR